MRKIVYTAFMVVSLILATLSFVSCKVYGDEDVERLNSVIFENRSG